MILLKHEHGFSSEKLNFTMKMKQVILRLQWGLQLRESQSKLQILAFLFMELELGQALGHSILFP